MQIIINAYRSYQNRRISPEQFTATIESEMTKHPDVNVFDVNVSAAVSFAIPLFKALIQDNACSLWLSKKCMDHYVDAQGNNLLFYAAKYMDDSSEHRAFVKRVMPKGSSVSDSLFFGLNHKRENILFYALLNGNEKFLDYLKAQHPQALNDLLSAKTRYGKTVFHAVAFSGSRESWVALKQLLGDQEAKALINTPDAFDWTPLACAVLHENRYFVHEVLRRAYFEYQEEKIPVEEFIQTLEQIFKFDYLNSKSLFSFKFYSDSHEKNFSLFAGLINDPILFNWLVKKCVAGYKDKAGRSLLFYALKYGDTKLPTHLADKFPNELKHLLSEETEKKENAYHAAAAGGNIDNWQLAQKYLGDGANDLMGRSSIDDGGLAYNTAGVLVYCPGTDSKTPIFIAAKHGRWNLVTHLRTNFQLSLPSTELPNLFIDALEKGDIDGVRELIFCGAAVNEQVQGNDGSLCYPLDLALNAAAKRSVYNAEIIELLISHGAKTDHDLDSRIHLPLIYAIQEAKFRNIRILLSLAKDKTTVVKEVFLADELCGAYKRIPSWLFTPESDEEKQLSIELFQILLIIIPNFTAVKAYWGEDKSADVQKFVEEKNRGHLFNEAKRKKSWHIIRLLWNDAEYNQFILGMAAEYLVSGNADDCIGILSTAGLWDKILCSTDQDGRNLLHWIALQPCDDPQVLVALYKRFVTLQLAVDDQNNTPLVYLIANWPEPAAPDVSHFLIAAGIPLTQAFVCSGDIDDGYHEQIESFITTYYPELYVEFVTGCALIKKIEEIEYSKQWRTPAPLKQRWAMTEAMLSHPGNQLNKRQQKKLAMILADFILGRSEDESDEKVSATTERTVQILSNVLCNAELSFQKKDRDTLSQAFIFSLNTVSLEQKKKIFFAQQVLAESNSLSQSGRGKLLQLSSELPSLQHLCVANIAREANSFDSSDQELKCALQARHVRLGILGQHGKLSKRNHAKLVSLFFVASVEFPTSETDAKTTTALNSASAASAASSPAVPLSGPT